MIDRAVRHIKEVAGVPSFSTYEKRLHPYVRSIFDKLSEANEIEAPGNNLIFQLGSNPKLPTIALTAHLDKINHYGTDYPPKLPVEITDEYIEGTMDDSAGLGMILTLAEEVSSHDWPNLLFFFSEMEESKGLKEHPELLKNNGEGYSSGMGAKQISKQCLAQNLIPKEIITLDTTPLFKGKPGIAIYMKHWELNSLDASDNLVEATDKTVARFKEINDDIKIDNNTNDYLHYGEVFNRSNSDPVVSIALEPAIYPYHQKGERVFVDDIRLCLEILAAYLRNFAS